MVYAIRAFPWYVHLKGLAIVSVVILDKGQDPGLQVLNGDERATFEQLTNQDAEPDFNLIQPGTVLGGVMEHHLMGRHHSKRPHGWAWRPKYRFCL